MRILVIDDDEGMRKVLEILLGEEGYQVFVATDGPKGIEIVKKNGDALNLVITDRNMPGMLGEEVVRFIKLNYPHIKVILMTAELDDVVVSVAKAAGADIVIEKSLYTAEKIKEFLEREVKDVLRN